MVAPAWFRLLRAGVFALVRRDPAGPPWLGFIPLITPL
jgi:hypothetical protein